MGPTEILANQHFQLAKKIFGGTNIKIEFISGKTEVKKRKKFYKNWKMEKLIFYLEHTLYFKGKLNLKN